MAAITLNNTGPETIVDAERNIRLKSFSKVIQSEIDGSFTLGEYSCVNRSHFGRYSGVGSLGYVTDTTVGRYCTFGSRLSIGAFNHPTDWLSVHEFAYRDISGIYGETIIDGGRNLLLDGTRPTRIGNDVWIGDNATVKRGVTINDGAVIGLSAVVTRDVEPYGIVVGNPGRILRKRFSDTVIAKLLELQWWKMDLQSLRGIDFQNIERAIQQLNERAK